MKRHHFEEDGVFDWSSYGVNVLTPRRQPGGESEEDTSSKKSRNKLARLTSNNNNNNNNDLQVPFIPVLHQVISFHFWSTFIYSFQFISFYTPNTNKNGMLR